MRRPLRLVVDTNVVVSAVLWGGRPGELIAAAGEGEVRLHSSRDLLDELRATLERPKLARHVEARALTVDGILADYRRLVTLTRRALPAGAWSRDPDDDLVIACALAARADFIVTGDDDLLTLGVVDDVRIVTVTDLLKVFAA
jgi:putative PIN family toxin of toxin-antitoxin system